MPTIFKLSFKKFILLILLLVIFLGMAVFGVNKFNSTSSSALIKVGKIEVPTNLFLSEFNLIQQQNAYMLAQNPYLLSNVLQGMISRYVSSLMFVNEANTLHIGASEDLVYKVISNTPYFLDENKKFNKELFKTTISKVYGTEDNYINMLKNDLKQTQLTGILLTSIYQPVKISDYFVKSLQQTREVDFIIFSRKDVTNLGTPSSSDLLHLRDSNKDLYTVSEFRNLEVLEVNPTDYLKNISVSDEEIKNYYSSHKKEFLTEETRDITQILVSDKKEADKIYNALKTNPNLDKSSYQVTKLNSVDKPSLPTELANIVFNAKEGEVNSPIKTDMGYHIIIVNKINSSLPIPLENIKSRITTIISSNKMAKYYEELKDKLAKEAKSNKTIKEIQKEFNGKIFVVKNVNKYGFDEKNNLLTGVTQNQDILTSAFTLPVNQLSNIINSNGKFYLVETTKIIPEHLRTLEEAKEDLTKQWKYNKATGIIKAKAEKFIESINTKNMDPKVKLQHVTLTRSKTDNQGVFNAQALDLLFLSRINSPVEGNLDNGDIYVAIVKKISNSNNTLSKHDNQQVVEYVANNFKEDILTQLFAILSNQYKVNVNQKALQNILGTK